MPCRYGWDRALKADKNKTHRMDLPKQRYSIDYRVHFGVGWLQSSLILPRQHYTMVYSMRANQQMPRDRAGHGQATTEQT